MTEQELYQEVREAIAKLTGAMLMNVSMDYINKQWNKASFEEKDYFYKFTDSILSIPNIAVADREAELPDIPTFGYDKETDIPLLKRGAINYSKMIKDGYVKEVERG